MKRILFTLMMALSLLGASTAGTASEPIPTCYPCPWAK